MEYRVKLEKLHQEMNSEGIVSDYALYQAFKRMFDTPNLNFYQFGILKNMILDFMRKKGIK